MSLRILSIIAAAALTATAAFAENPPPREIWPQATAAAMNGDVNAAIQKTNELVTTGRAYGIVGYPLYASSAAALAREAAKQGRGNTANWAVKAADQLDPRSAAVAFSNADRAGDKRDWSHALTYSVSGVTRLFSRYRTRMLSQYDLILALSLAAALTIAAFALTLFMRYGRALAHDFRELVGLRLHGGAVTVVAFALLFLPVFLWLGPAWLILYWFVIFFGYAGVIERVVIVLLALVLASLPLIVDHTASRIAGIDSPVMMATIASHEQSYEPEALRRVQELAAVIPDEPTVQLLLGNLELQDGNEQQAEIHYRRSSEIKDSAGAHVNLGNLHFLDNDFAAANTEYEKAEQLDPRLAIAFYNNSVASGDAYKFDEQGQKLERAKSIDRGYIERVAANPPSQKIVIYTPPIDQAWAVASAVARRSAARTLFGTYAYFDPMASAMNAVTIGSVVAVLLALALWAKRRRAGFANACIKCGRTFCHRCKSARESATYCTQCIHIYLKRDGVSLDTKRSKLDEVHSYHTGMLKRDKLAATFLPGSAQILEGKTVLGLIGLFVFLLFVSIAILTGRLAPALGPVAELPQMLVRIATGLLALVLWFVLTLPVYRRRPAA